MKRNVSKAIVFFKLGGGFSGDLGKVNMSLQYLAIYCFGICVKFEEQNS